MEEIEMAKFKVGDYIHAKANIGGHMIGKIIKISNDSRHYYVQGTYFGNDGRKQINYVVLWCHPDGAYSVTIPPDKFDWDAFKRGDVTVTFKTNESQSQFLKRCDMRGLKWASGENPTTRSYINLEALEIGDGGLYYRYAVDSTPTVYDWDARRYIKRETPNSDWTAEEIEQAKELSHKLLCKIFDEGKYSVVWCVNRDYIGMSITRGFPYKIYYGFWSRPQGNDKFNPWIGKCVCLCKATQTPIPSFILNKNKEMK